jgi:hypothetical protein
MSFDLTEKSRLRVFGNKILSRICGSERKELLEVWKKILHSLVRHNLYYKDVKIKECGIDGHVAFMGETINAYSDWLRDG